MHNGGSTSPELEVEDYQSTGMMHACIIIKLIMYNTIEIWRETEEEIDIMVEEAALKPKSTIEYCLVMMVVQFLIRLQSKHYIPDSAITSILKFLYTLFVVIGKFSHIAKTMAEIIPQNIYSLKKLVLLLKSLLSVLILSAIQCMR